MRKNSQISVTKHKTIKSYISIFKYTAHIFNNLGKIHLSTFITTCNDK